MKIVEYKLHAMSNGMTTPGFIRNGGHYSNPDDNTLLGFVPDPCEYYLPDTLQYLTLDEAKIRQLLIHSKTPMLSQNIETMEMTSMTDAEVEAQMDVWYTANI
jgi:hypothetical protein|tara:strand:+ start:135 stop:443 length:309 start_codon:yes stop_codon:yes gene_type:complete